MAITLVPNGKKSPTDASAPMLYYPRVIKKGEVDLEQLSDEISAATSLSQGDCYAAVISLTKMMQNHLELGEIVRLGQLGSFQISVKGIGTTTAEAVAPKSVKSASIIFRPGKRLKLMLQNLKFKMKY
ncbi:HU family DNA-binding protein [Flavobacterium sp.]